MKDWKNIVFVSLATIIWVFIGFLFGTKFENARINYSYDIYNQQINEQRKAENQGWFTGMFIDISENETLYQEWVKTCQDYYQKAISGWEIIY